MQDLYIGLNVRYVQSLVHTMLTTPLTTPRERSLCFSVGVVVSESTCSVCILLYVVFVFSNTVSDKYRLQSADYLKVI